MSEAKTAASDMAMKGGGYYSLATIGAKDVIDSAMPLALDAIGQMDLWVERPFVLADMGCADGGTSLDLVAQAVNTLGRANPQRPIAVYYTDQLRNDYNALFNIVENQDGLASRTERQSDLHLFASATSFYDQILPAGTLDLGFSATAMHWLSHKPCDISDHVQAVGASGAELAAFAAQGNADWQTILLHRARELAPGGRLVIANFCRDESGRYLGHTEGVDMFDTFNRIWRECLADGRIEQAEYLAMTLPQYYKAVEEFAAPLQDEENPVHQAGLRLEHMETRVTPCPYAADFRRHGDAARFAKAYVPTLRSWTESTFHAGLAQSRPAEERQRLIDSYYARYEDLVREAPDGHAMDYVHAFMTIAKL
ncbi:MAG: SAM-dependent methyltransferase [Pseudomonadota bacterium]